MVALEAGVAARAEPFFKIAHQLPDRVRLVCESADCGVPLARRVALHPDVREVRWRPAARSMTIRFDPRTPFAQIIDELPPERRLGAPVLIVGSPQRGPVRALLSLLEVVRGGPVALASLLAEELAGVGACQVL